MQLQQSELTAHVSRALAEDVGRGDVTSILTVPADSRGEALLVAREEGVLAGVAALLEVCRQVDPRIEVRLCVVDGDSLAADQTVCRLLGPSRSLLTAERTALNYLQHLSGIATRTARFVKLVAGTGARVVDTRKTIPGMRLLAKYAVRVGGGSNHRFGLDDGILIKDNHIAAAGGINAAVSAARRGAPHLLKIEVEVEDLAQVAEALDARADLLLLDNMSLEALSRAVDLARGRALTEASGGIREETIRAVAECGVDLISIGALTHSVRAMDFALDWGSTASA